VVSESDAAQPREVVWVGSSKKDLLTFPGEVQDVIGYALYLAQIGSKHDDAKPLRGFRGAGVLEIRENFDGDTYRAVYTVTLKTAVYMLHAFQKKARRGIATTQQDMELIKRRLQAAQVLDRQRQQVQEGKAE
jgi:phage-related protein